MLKYLIIADLIVMVVGCVALVRHRVIYAKLLFALCMTGLALLTVLAPPPGKETGLERKTRLLQDQLKELSPADPARAKLERELEQAKKFQAEYDPAQVGAKIEELRAKLPTLAGDARTAAEDELRQLGGLQVKWYDRLPFKLGLDLRGGTEVRLRLQPDDTRLRKLQDELHQAVLAGQEKAPASDQLRKEIKEETSNREANLNDAANVIRARLNNSGLAEIPVTRMGGNRVLVQLPGMDSGEARSLVRRIQRLGNLEFRLVVGGEGPGANQRLLEQLQSKNYDHDVRNFCAEADRVLNAEEIDKDGRSLKYGSRLYDWLRTPDKIRADGSSEKGQFHLVEQQVQLTGEHIIAARAGPSMETPGTFEINIALDNVGSKIFERVTAANVKRQLAIVLDGKLKSAPVLRETISGGHARISGDFSPEESDDLAVVLKSGSLKVNIEKEYENTVGPTLGEDSIRQGLLAMAVGLVAVVGFMFAYYLLAGVVTDLVLVVNVLLIAAFLVIFGATLTLPGIAGLILTVGMAVDANVLIFERIREEREKGNSLVRSLALGYERAFVTILDANVTTLITALILHSFGTEAVKGFAATLMVGIVTSMFCSLVLTRWVFEALIEFRRLSDLKMMRFFHRPAVDFISLRRPAMLGSAVCIAVGLVVFAGRGERNWGHDFTGGTLAHIAIEKPLPMAEARSLARSKLAGQFPDAADGLQSFGEPSAQGYHEFVLRTKLVRPEGEAAATPGATHSAEEFKNAIAAAFPLQPEGLKVLGEQTDRSSPSETFYRVHLSLRQPQSPRELTTKLRERTQLIEPRVAAGDELPPLPLSGKARLKVRLNAPAGVEKPDAAAWQTALVTAAAGVGAEAVDWASGAKFSEKLPDGRVAFELTLKKPCHERGLLNLLGGAASPLQGVEVSLIDAQEPPAPSETPATGLTVVCGAPNRAPTGEPLAPEAREQLVRDQFRALRNEGLIDFTEPFPRFTSVGPMVATEMTQNAILALVYSMIAIFFYIWLRFQFRVGFGLGAVVALIHDVLFTLGMLAIGDQLGLINGQIDLTIVAAILTLVGYSLNDTIVVFDRIRENLHGGRDIGGTINDAVNQTLSRTVITSLTTLLVVVALLVFGGGVIRGFAYTLFVGIVVGTYSSIFIASPVLVEFSLFMTNWRRRKLGQPAVAAVAATTPAAPAAPSGNGGEGL